jgi:hypothetical protein
VAEFLVFGIPVVLFQGHSTGILSRHGDQVRLKGELEHPGLEPEMSGAESSLLESLIRHAPLRGGSGAW